MWKQPSGVKLSTAITLHSEGQTVTGNFIWNGLYVFLDAICVEDFFFFFLPLIDTFKYLRHLDRKYLFDELQCPSQ